MLVGPKGGVSQRGLTQKVRLQFRESAGSTKSEASLRVAMACPYQKVKTSVVAATKLGPAA